MAKNNNDKTSSKKPAAKKAKSPDTPAEKPNTKARTLAVLAVGLIVVVALFALNAGGLAKMGVEKIASQTLGVKVSLETLNVKLQEREVDATVLEIANPEGFSGEKAITVGGIYIAAEEISGEKLFFDTIRVTGTVVNLEVAESSTNLIKLHENMNALASRKHNPDRPVKIIIRELYIEGASINPAVTLGERELQPVKMPDIRITGIGEEEGGVTASEAMTIITDRVITVAMRSAVQNQFLYGMDQESLAQIQQALGLPTGLIDQMRGFGEKVKSLFQDD